jgi:hypothetical protein
MGDETYQGWSNRETWAVNLHLSNDQGLYDQVNEMAEEVERDPFKLANRLQDFVSDELLSPDWYRDELGTAMPDAVIGIAREIGSTWRVDWNEIAKAWLED